MATDLCKVHWEIFTYTLLTLEMRVPSTQARLPPRMVGVSTSSLLPKTQTSVSQACPFSQINTDLFLQDRSFAHNSGVTPTGQVLILAAVHQHSSLDVCQASEIIKGFLLSHGQLFAFFRLCTFPDGSFRAMAEFCSTSAAATAVSSCARASLTEVTYQDSRKYN